MIALDGALAATDLAMRSGCLARFAGFRFAEIRSTSCPRSGLGQHMVPQSGELTSGKYERARGAVKSLQTSV